MSKSYWMSFRLVGPKEQQKPGCSEVLLAGCLINAVAVRKVPQTECPGQGIASGIVAYRADIGVVGAASFRRESPESSADCVMFGFPLAAA
jgi:hypothetical protein